MTSDNETQNAPMERSIRRAHNQVRLQIRDIVVEEFVGYVLIRHAERQWSFEKPSNDEDDAPLDVIYAKSADADFE